jgi:hypothetical protein
LAAIRRNRLHVRYQSHKRPKKAANKSFDDLRAATVQMNNDVLDYLVAVARGQQQ